MNNHTLQNTKGELTDLEAIKIATASHRSRPSSPAAASLHGKTQGLVLRLPPQHKAHATSMQPLQCVLQPRLPKHHVAAKRRNSQNTSNQHLHCELRRAQPAPAAHTRYPSPPPAAALHGKTEGPMLHAAITNAFCNQGFRSTMPLLSAETRKTHRTSTYAASPHPPHTQGTLHRRLQPLHTEKQKVFCSGFLLNTSPMQHSCSHSNAI